VRYKSATDYNVQISFLTQGDVDNLGNIASPSVYCVVWASVKEVPITRGGALLKADQIVQRAFYTVVTRYRDDVDESMLVQCNNQLMQIDSMGDVDGRGVELHLVCSAVDTVV
jgi:SPP1 family predicted phage head-tail adaptor